MQIVPADDHEPTDPPEQADETSHRRAVGAGLGMLVVVLTYEASRYGTPSRWWAAVGAVVVAIAIADRLHEVRRLLPTPGIAPLTIVASWAAVVLCVPETNQLPMVGLVPLSLAVLEVVGRRQMSIEGYALAATAVGWGAMFGATGRQSALAGALFASWAVLLPAVVLRRWQVTSTAHAHAIAGLGAAAALVMARTGGIAHSWSVILVSAVACGALSRLAAWVVARHSHSKTRPSKRSA